MAPRAHHLVLRDLRAGAVAARLPRRSIRRSACCSTPTTTASATAIRGPSAACSRGPTSRGARLPRARRRRDAASCSRARVAADAGRARRARPPARAAAPGADPHRRQAPALAQPARAGLPRAAGRSPPVRPPPLRLGRVRRRACVEIGHAGAGFAFDNEAPRHRVHLAPFALAIAAGHARRVSSRSSRTAATQRPELWLSDGWDVVAQRGLARAAVLGRADGDRWTTFTLARPRAARPARAGRATSASTRPTPSRAGPARGCRPRPSGRSPPRARRSRATSLESGVLHPLPLAPRRRRGRAAQLFGDVWEWTRSAYAPYPGLPAGRRRARRVQRQVHVQPVRAARRLVRHAAPRTSARRYRNFFPPDARWQFSGIRLARDAA